MNYFRRLHRIIPLLSIITFLSLSLSPVQAAMINNDVLLTQAQHQVSVQQVLSELDRQQVKDKLIAMGVDPADAKTRISQLSESELAQIRDNFEQLPAAGTGIIGALLVIFVVLVVTDMLGATDVFTFVHDINH